MTTTSRPGIRRLLCVLAGALCLAVPQGARAQLFLASRPDPPFTIGPLIVRGTISEGSDAVRVSLLWSLVIPAGVRPADVAQDLYLLWPGEVQEPAAPGQPEPTLARYVEERGFSVIRDGRLPLFGQSLSDGGAPRPEPAGAPFAVFVQEGGVLGLSPPATLIRIPWSARLADSGWLMDLRMKAGGLIKPRKGTWAEQLFVGGRYLYSMSFNEVRDRPLFPMYFAHRDRVVRLADAPSELVASFTQSDRLKIDQVFPPTAIRRLSETEETTEVVSLFLDKTEGITPQHLAVQFGYFSRVQAWALILIPALFFVLGQAMGPLLGRSALRLVTVASARVHLAGWNRLPRVRQTGVILSRETLEHIVPGRTTREEVLRLCGPAMEAHEEFPGSERRTLVYRGHRLVPKTRRHFGWFSTVEYWEAERHEVTIELERDAVRDVHAHVRYYRVSPGQQAEGAPGTQ
ncbi:MAG TPA: hypothetical protein VGT40_07665 [Methylomirabilota bacterium]|nr:hypothetical protein [Methylomirabilota bacterium]